MLLRVWWIPQVPMPAFRKEVRDLVEAKVLLDTLAAYDAFQFEHNLKADYFNVGGLEMYEPEDEDWYEWYDPQTGENINRLSIPQLEQCQAEEKGSTSAV